MRVYLAGPMRGIALNNAPAFHSAAAWLRFLGHTVWSPAEHDEELGVDACNADLRGTFERDIRALLAQEAVVLLPGWEHSVGACLERHAADVCGVPVYLIVGTEGSGLILLRPRDWRLVRSPIVAANH